MSDIKNEIDRIKQDIQEVSELPWQYLELNRSLEYDAVTDANGKRIIGILSYTQENIDFLLLAVNNISSLITTIESQNSQIESLKAITELKNEEIAELKAEMVSIGKFAAIGLKKNDPYDMKLSLQAIEMAVDHA